MSSPAKAYGRHRWHIKSKVSLDSDVFAYADVAATGPDGSLVLSQEIEGQVVPSLVIAAGCWSMCCRVSDGPGTSPDPLAIEYWNLGASADRPPRTW